MVTEKTDFSRVILSAEEVTGGYGQKTVIDRCSFNLEEGEFLGIIGPNGSGKTTLVRLLTGLLKPFSGRIYYRGRLLSRIPPVELARQVAFLPASVETTFPFTVKEFVALGRLPFSPFWRPPPEGEAVVRESLELVDAAALAEVSVREISEGERRRVFLAQALAQKPRLLVLDEPTAHLDIGHQLSVMDLLRMMNQRQGLTLVCVLHDLNLSADYCERLMLLNEGRIFATGPPEEVLQPEIIEAVYRGRVLRGRSPATGRPHLFGQPRAG